MSSTTQTQTQTQTKIKTVLVDTIADISDHLSSMSSLPSLVPLLVIAYKTKIPPPSVQERLASLMRIMSAPSQDSKLPSRSYNHDELLNSFINFLSPILNGMAGMEDFEAAVGAFKDGEDFRDFWTLEGSNLIREVIEGTGQGRAMKGRDMPFVKVFVKDASCRVAYGGGKGALFLVPGETKVGDEIWSGEEKALVRILRGGEDVGGALLDTVVS